jgi:hypothetical protein
MVNAAVATPMRDHWEFTVDRHGRFLPDVERYRHALVIRHHAVSLVWGPVTIDLLTKVIHQPGTDNSYQEKESSAHTEHIRGQVSTGYLKVVGLSSTVARLSPWSPLQRQSAAVTSVVIDGASAVRGISLLLSSSC